MYIVIINAQISFYDCNKLVIHIIVEKVFSIVLNVTIKRNVMI